MSFLHGTEEYYQKFIELQEKLRKSEEERLKLEMKFNEMVQVSREEEQIYYRKLRAQYKRFLEEDRRRQERNERILRILERIESRAAMLAAKTQRFELLRKQYHAYLQRIFANVKQQDGAQVPPRMPTIVEPKQPQNELARSPKVDVVKQYLSSLSSPTCRKEVLKAARSNELLPLSDASSEDYNLPKYKSSASCLADQIIHSIHARPKIDARPNPEEEGRIFCGTKLSPPRPPVRKSDDVELLDYGGAGDQHERLSEKKIVQDNYQNEKFFRPEEEDVRPSVRFHDHYLPESFSVEKVDFPKPESPSPKHTQPTVSESVSPKRPDLHEPEAPERVDYLHEPAATGSKDHEEEVGENEEVGSCDFEDNQKPEGETPEANGDGVEDGEGRTEAEEEDVQDEIKSTPQSDQNDEAFVNSEVTLNEDQKEMEDQDQVEAMIYDEAKKNEIEVRDDVEKTGNASYEETVQDTPDEGDETVQYASNEGDQPIQYDELGQPIQYDEQYDEHGRAVQYDEHGQPIPYDEQGQPIAYDEFIQYDEQGQPIQYDEQGRPIQYDDEQNRPIQYDEQGRPIEYDERGRPIQYDDVQGQPIQYDEQNRPIQYDEQGQPVQYDEQGRPIQYDDVQGRPIQYDEQNRPIQYDEQGRPIQYDDVQGRPIQYDEQNQPVQYDEQGQPIQYDEHGRTILYDEQGRPTHSDEKGGPIQYDEQGRPIQYDEQGRSVQYDEQGHPIQYDEQGQYYDEQGQPLYQYDPNNEYYQQQQYEDVQSNQDQIGSPEVTEKAEAVSVVQPQNEGGVKEVEGTKEEGELETSKQKPNVMDMLDTDTESTRQEAKVSNESDFDFSNS